ncbi:MAG: galactokinase, partial [Acidobacteriota bacterium]
GPYNRLAEGAGALLGLWNVAATSPAHSLAEAMASSGEAVERLEQLAARSQVAGWPAAALGARLAHFLREDARITPAIEALRAGDAAALGALSADSQQDAETLLGNQIPETVALAHAARHLGAFAASSFGAGFGGSLWALVEADAADNFASRWHPQAFVMRPGSPLSEL